MPVNADYEYSNAMKEYLDAPTDEGRLQALQKMLSKAPNHKSSQTLRADIKSRISKLKEKLLKQKKQAKKSTQISIKKEGAATIVFVGTTNTGKSTLLKELTRAKMEVNNYGYTTKKPEVGTHDYHGVKLQLIEMPSLFENFGNSPKGPAYLALIRQADLILLFFKTPEERNMLHRELTNANISVPTLIYNNQQDVIDRIWKRLPIMKVQAKTPGKKPDYPPIALKKGSTVRNLAEYIHKVFLKKFKFARIWGKSARFQGQVVGYDHVLEDDDIVEIHTK